jgi:cell division protein FtsW (lipid II flippase)
MHLAFDIFQGLGIAAAAGLRPFLPALLTGALAAGDIQIDFRGTDYAFLQRAPFLLVVLVVACVLVLAEWRWRSVADRRPVALALLVPSLAIGAILFAGALAQDGHTTWPGLVAGVACALIGAGATIPLLRRARARLDSEAAGATALFADGAAIVIAGLSVLAPPVGLVALVALAWLLVSGWRRQPQKYAGLRILR